MIASPDTGSVSGTAAGLAHPGGDAPAAAALPLASSGTMSDWGVPATLSYLLDNAKADLRRELLLQALVDLRQLREDVACATQKPDLQALRFCAQRIISIAGSIGASDLSVRAGALSESVSAGIGARDTRIRIDQCQQELGQLINAVDSLTEQFMSE